MYISLRVPTGVCAVDAVSPSSSTSECALLDSDRDTTFDDFDLENDLRLEVTEMFQSSSVRSRQNSRRGSESDADWSAKDDSAYLSINIPASYRSLLTSVHSTLALFNIFQCCICTVFSARQHAERAICYRKSVCLSVCSSVCLSVCPSHGWISRKRLKLGSCKFHRTVAPSL